MAEADPRWFNRSRREQNVSIIRLMESVGERLLGLVVPRVTVLASGSCTAPCDVRCVVCSEQPDTQMQCTYCNLGGDPEDITLCSCTGVCTPFC